MFKRIRRWFRKPASVKGHVYYVRLKTPQGVFYKLGFTGKSSLIERLAYGGHGDEKLIDQEFFFTYRDDAWDVEQLLLGHFDKKRAFGKRSKDPSKPLCGRGQTELFATDILGLDHALYIRPPLPTEAGQEAEEVLTGCLLIILATVFFPITLMWGLFLCALWFFSFIGSSPALRRTSTVPTYPKHPPNIKELVDSLCVSANGVPVRYEMEEVGGHPVPSDTDLRPYKDI